MSTIAAPSAYEQHRDYVLNVLGRRCGWLNEPDREAIWHDAYTVMLEKQREDRLDLEVMNDHQVRAYLTQTALNKALREGDRAHRKRSVALEDGGLEVAGGEPDADILLAQNYEGARLREIVAELPERQQAVIKLRFFFDRAPDEIQSYLGVTERVYRRELERAMRTLNERFEQVREGTFCESRRSLILAYVAGIAGPNRMRHARRHLDSCPACSHWAVQLRETARQAGAVVPMPLLTGEIAQRGHRLSGSGHGVGVVRDRLADALAGAREHATGLVVRTDPGAGTVLGGLRPGAAVAAVAGCLAIGSGATYCALNGIPKSLRSLVGASTEHNAKGKRTTASPPRAAATPATTSARRSQSPSSTSSSTGQQTKQQRQRAKTEQAERKTAAEFGVEASGSSTSGSSTSTSPSTSTSSSGSTSSSSGGQWGSEFGP